MPDRSDLAQLLDEATTQLQQLIEASGVPEDLEKLLPHLDATQQNIRRATLGFRGPPTADEARAFRDWDAAATRLQTLVQDHLRHLDGQFGDVRKARSALRAYSTLDPHHKAQRLHKKL